MEPGGANLHQVLCSLNTHSGRSSNLCVSLAFAHSLGDKVASESDKERLTRWQRVRAEFWPTWITRDTHFLLAARICMSAVRALAGVVVPIYLAIIGYNGLALGLLFAVVAFTSALLSGLIGLLSDRFGRKPFIIALPWLAALAAFAFAFTRVEVLLFIFAALGSFGRGAGASAGNIGPYQPAEQALLANSVSARHRNSLFGQIAFASSLGALIGTGPLTSLPNLLPLVGLPRLQGLAPYRLTFLVMAGFALVAGLLALPIADPTTAHAASNGNSRSAVNPKQEKAHRRLHLNISSESWSILLRLWITNSFNGLAVGFFGPFITYWFYQRYGAGPATIGLLFSVINLASMASNLGAARIAARLGLVRTIAVSRALQAVLILPMVLVPNFWLAGGFYLVRMLAQRIGLPLRQSYIMGVVPTEERGTVGALANLPAQATSATSPALAGYLFDHVSLALPFEIGAVLQGINTLLFFIFFRTLLPPEEQEKLSSAAISSPQVAEQEHDAPL